MGSNASPRLEVWEAGTAFNRGVHVVLAAGLIDELRANPDGPRREELAGLIAERFRSYTKQRQTVSFQDIIWTRTISRVRDGETSLV